MGTASEEQEQSETMLRWDLGEEVVIYYGQHDGSELSEVQIEAKLEVQAKTKKNWHEGRCPSVFCGRPCPWCSV